MPDYIADSRSSCSGILEQFSVEFVSDGQGLCPWNPLGEMISPRPPQRGMCNFKVNLL